MPNSYFQFKQFTVYQERAALKVSTDSCLFGAWIGKEVRGKKYEVRKKHDSLTIDYSPFTTLDIGAGTGLLMLMLAQKVDVLIDGIEIDEPSYFQAKENLNASPWKERLHLFLGDVKELEFEKKYDFIISNPPFYEGDLKSDASNRNVAMHDEGLKLDELLKVVDKNLSDEGFFAVLLPYHRVDKFIADAELCDLYLLKRTDVKQTVNHSFFRTMLLFGRNKVKPEEDSMAIKNEKNEYTVEFIELLKEYYLYL
jgi:tRNA1Val (adenine37-N6)-methyltransferase